jgi:hypothetical protein
MAKEVMSFAALCQPRYMFLVHGGQFIRPMAQTITANCCGMLVGYDESVPADTPKSFRSADRRWIAALRHPLRFRRAAHRALAHSGVPGMEIGEVPPPGKPLIRVE